jgi:hypothetical protein
MPSAESTTPTTIESTTSRISTPTALPPKNVL